MQLGAVFHGITKVTLGNGSSSLFWKDVWFDDGDTSLMEIYPRAFSFCLNEDELVAKNFTATDPSLIFHLPLSTQAHEEVREIQQGTMHVLLDEGCTDAWECNLGGAFSSKRYYDHCFRDIAADDAFRWLWKAKSPIKFKMFGWLLFVDRLNTRNMLRRRHFVVAGNTYTCMLCQNPLRKRRNTSSSLARSANSAGIRLGCFGQALGTGSLCCTLAENTGGDHCLWTSS